MFIWVQLAHSSIPIKPALQGKDALVDPEWLFSLTAVREPLQNALRCLTVTKSPWIDLQGKEDFSELCEDVNKPPAFLPT